MIGLSNPRFRSRLASLSRLSYIVVAFAVAFVGLTLAGVGFGFVFNFTHSAPFGLYKEMLIQRERLTLLPSTSSFAPMFAGLG